MIYNILSLIYSELGNNKQTNQTAVVHQRFSKQVLENADDQDAFAETVSKVFDNDRLFTK